MSFSHLFLKLPGSALLAVFRLDFLGISLPPCEVRPLGDNTNQNIPTQTRRAPSTNPPDIPGTRVKGEGILLDLKVFSVVDVQQYSMGLFSQTSFILDLKVFSLVIILCSSMACPRERVVFDLRRCPVVAGGSTYAVRKFQRWSEDVDVRTSFILDLKVNSLVVIMLCSRMACLRERVVDLRRCSVVAGGSTYAVREFQRWSEDVVDVLGVCVVGVCGLPHKWGQKSRELLQDPLSTVYPSKRRG